MSAACIAHENLADDATVLASTQELLLPVSNLQNPHVARKYRSVLSSATVVFDLGAAISIDTLAIFGLNAETIRARVSATDSTGATGELYDSASGNIDADYPSMIYLIGSPVVGRYISFAIATTSAAYIEAGRVFIGTRTQFSINFAYNWQRQYVDRSVRAKTRGGQTQINPDVTYRTVDLTFGFLSESEKNGVLETIDRVNGMSTDVLFIIDPESTNLPRDTIWGLVSNLTPVVQPYFDRFSKQYQIEERL